MKIQKTPALALAFFSLAALLFLVACPTSDEPNRVLNMQIDKDNDSLLHFDSLIVKVYSKDSSFSYEVFHGVLRDPKQVLGMPLDPRVGKEYTVSIVGYKGGKVGVNKVVTILGTNNFKSKDVPIQKDKPQDTVIIIEPLIPEILAPSDTSVTEGDSLRFRVSVRNPLSGATTLTLKNAIPGAALDTAGRDPGDGYFTWRPSLTQGRIEPYAVTFVYASADRKVEKTVSVKVLNLNRPPKLSAIPDQKAKENETLSFKVEVSDPDHDSITLTASGLPDGATFAAGTFTWKPSVGQAGNYPVKFRAFDGVDSDLVAALITVGNVDVPPPLTVKITSPAHDTTVNFTPITILYTVNGTQLQRKFPLKDGKTKLFVDTTVAGRTGFDTITITLDTIPPGRPTVNGASPVNTRTPSWSWSSGGNGSGLYRFRLDNEDLSAALPTTDTAYTPSKDQDPVTHTLFVQERDAAGNWSPAGKRAVRIDTTRPPAPTVMAEALPTNNTRPAWTWKGITEDVTGLYRYKLDDPDLRTGTVEGKDGGYTPKVGEELKEGAHTLYVQQQDSAGNWSNSGSFVVRVDLTPPAAPKVKTTTPSPTNVPKPTWAWSSGGNGGKGTYRLKLDDSVLTSGALSGTNLSFTPDTDLKEGSHVLYVQETDSAGNWSKSASQELRVDLTPPSAPVVTASSWHTINPKPTWFWSSGGNGGSGIYRYKLNDSSLQSGATVLSDSTYTSSLNLAVGSRNILYVQERDSSGNWSQTGSLSIRIHGQTGYAVGMGGAVYKTTDNGLTWNAASSPNSFPIFAVWFMDANTGFFANALGKIYRTTNGATSWDTVPSGSTQAIKSFSFPDANTGYASGSGGTIVKTVNGGISWSLLSSGTAQGLNSIYFLDASNGFAAGAGGTIIKTVNGGSSWTPLAKPIDSLPELGLSSIVFTTSGNGYAAGNGGIIRTVDGGKTWKPIAGITPRLYTSICFTDANIGYVVGQDGTMLKTKDGGATWNVLVTVTTEHLSAVYFTDSNTGFAIGSESLFLSTTDGKSLGGINVGMSQFYGLNFP